MTMAVKTSFKVWQPRYILEKPMSKNNSTHRNFFQFFSEARAREPKRAVPLWVCPLGKE